MNYDLTLYNNNTYDCSFNLQGPNYEVQATIVNDDTTRLLCMAIPLISMAVNQLSSQATGIICTGIISGLSQATGTLLDTVNKLVFFQKYMRPNAPSVKAYTALQNAVEEGATDICQIESVDYLCKNNLGIPRNLMPQLTSENVLDAFFEHKIGQGHSIAFQRVFSTSLTPVQSEMNAKVVLNMLNAFENDTFDPCSSEPYGPIIVSLSNKRIYVIDGHHRYAACAILGGKISIFMITDQAKRILKELEAFPGVLHQSLQAMTKI